jgi:SAM-dependent methyltransferase
VTVDDNAKVYFEVLAEIGLTKHYGSLDATRELLDLCQISRGQKLLEVGCGVGATPVFAAKTIGCQVIGLDLIEKMLPQAQARARKNGVGDRVAFLAADARALPFPKDCFDAVLLESVTVFLEDKAGAIREYSRVTKPGGYVGFTELTWLRPPDQKLVDLFNNSAYATSMDAESWKKLLVDAGLENVGGKASRIDVSRESKGRLERYGLAEVLRVVLRMIRLILMDKQTRAIFRDGSGGLTKDVLDVVGYGVYAGRKSQA